MKTLMVSMALSCLFLMPTATSADMLELAKEKQCLSCHGQDDMTPRAPAFSSIAQKYSGEMHDYLVQVVLSGGEEHWGSAIMPEPGVRPEVSEEEARQLVDWILAMRKE
ncbi:c-type cytochrome [Halomonas sp. YLGW01]|uniref:c-type cytochrome n=1 Tax=Halomonas sp. YLGW01 TaxID=2773308 RepID=UPI00177F3EAE|nr:c-type cytochrome [Halomonas sp. YLGW01]